MRLAFLLSLLAACSGSKEPAPPAADTDVATSVPADPCARPALPEGLVELAWDDGAPTGDLEDQGWSYDRWVLGEERAWEAVRFDLEHPARVYGFSVMWTRVPEKDDRTLEAGLYGDFGYNGFDFWAPEPLWVGERCAADVTEGAWVDYVLDEPLVIEHPGLVYVAHERAGAGKPAFALDAGGAADCAIFADCHSAINLPELEAQTYYNGLSFPLGPDYLVRLHVEYTEQADPAEAVFQAVEGGPHGYRSSWGDYDADGDDDLLAGGAVLWRNEGDGTFVDATAEAGLAGLGASGGVWGDADNDGCLDLFLFRETYAAGDTLLRGDCASFTDVTAASGIDDVQDYNLCEDNEANVHAPSPAAAWLDIDADGLIDLYVVNFLCWDDYRAYRDTVFRNRGDWTFEEWTGEHGFVTTMLPGRGASPADADGDGLVDLLVHSYVLERNLYYHNLGGGAVEELGEATGLAGDPDSFQGATYYGHTIGSTWGDLDNDGDLDLVEANLAHPRFYHFSDKTRVLRNEGDGSFTDLGGDWTRPESAAGLRYQETHSVPVLADFDHDGALDLAISAVYDGRPTDFYWGNGDGTFRLDAYHSGLAVKNGWGMSTADFDQDGDPDLAVHGALYADTAADGHWLQVRAVGNVASNRQALGATIRAEAGGQRWTRHVSGGNGQGGQDSASVHFGLGDTTSIDQVVVDFPAGDQVVFPGPFAVDARIWVAEDGRTARGWAPPEWARPR